MRVIVFGRKSVIERLPMLLTDEVISLTGELEKMIALLNQDLFDLALVDSAAKDAEAACLHINKFLNVPIVLIIGKRKPNWDRLQSIGVDGYLPESAESDEVMARLRAMVRRLCTNEQVKKGNLELKQRENLEDTECEVILNWERNKSGVKQ